MSTLRSAPLSDDAPAAPPLRILVSDALSPDGLRVLTDAPDVAVDVRSDLDDDELAAAVAGYDALVIRSGTRVTQQILDAGDRLRVIGRAGVGVDNVDVEQATRHGVIVMNTPTGNTIATAEHAMALLLAAFRHIVPAHNAVADGRWERASFVGRELLGKTLGIIGLGRVGRAVAARAQAFGMRIVAADPFVREEVALEAGVELVDLDDLLTTADAVTLHTALVADTTHLIDAERLARCKPGTVLINAARGGLVDSAAVAAALDNGTLRCAALDVYDREPPAPDDPLIGHPQVIHTPHLGASTVEAQRAVSVEVAEQVVEALRGVRIDNSVNLTLSPTVAFARVDPFIALATKIGRLQSAVAGCRVTDVEVEMRSDDAGDLLRPVAAGLLSGVLGCTMSDAVNFVNAPIIAAEAGINICRTAGLGDPEGSADQLTSRASWPDGGLTIVGSVLSDRVPRITQVGEHSLELVPDGTVLVLHSSGVAETVAPVTEILARHGVRIGGWRSAPNADGTTVLSVVDFDGDPPADVVTELRDVAAVSHAVLVTL